MSTQQFGRWQRAVAIVPLALLSAAWTASLAGAGVTAAALADPSQQEEPLPDGATVPSEAIEAPASVSSGDGLGLGVAGDAQQVIATSSTNGIPAAALAAYQRAESVINSADEGCNLTWQLIAAIGRVESNHGRYGGNALDDDGIAQPGIYGIALNGSHNTSTIRDTDAGQFDNDLVYDRAVGPMQFIPSTWSVVGVDADGDGQRNPQDIDDAALATAVYLCSGDDDLSTTAGQRSAVYRYNHSQAYVDLVLSIMDAYLDGDFTSIPNNTSAAGLFVPEPSTGRGTGGTGPGGQGGPDADPGGQPGVGGETDGPGGGNPGGNDGPGDGDETPGGEVPDDDDLPTLLPPLPSTSVKPVDDLLNLTQATVQCTLDGFTKALDPVRFEQCLDDYMKP
ncbi:MAG: lytic transglycosylase domain-containing protein [Actinomycetota bacterium]|nr:lytic transglycosylase domain-containing protein [Actinomycetota bacterium]